jgi:hypothetical protein
LRQKTKRKDPVTTGLSRSVGFNLRSVGLGQ